jgi:hypothetical protein
MRVLGAFGSVCLVTVLAGTLASAHHSFSAEFDINKPVTLRGALTKMAWTNPHSWLYLDVKDAECKVVNWAVELGSPNLLFRRGLRRADFPPGLEVIVEGYLAKDGSPTANAFTVKTTDGAQLLYGKDTS